MSYSQDDFYSDDPIEGYSSPIRKKFPGFVAFLLFIFAGGSFLQTTLAANISLNPGGQVEFGQGVSATTACSGATNLTITPNSSFVNVAGGGAHYLSSVTVSNIPTSCYGDDFTIKAFNNSSSSPLAIFNTSSTSAVVWNDGGTFKLGTGSSGMTIAQSAGTFTVTFTSPVALSSTVYKLTVESGTHSDVYAVGLSGPGGGTVFYYSEAGFNCGPTFSSTGSPSGGKCNYLEAAVSNWSGGADPAKPWAISAYQNANISAIADYTTVHNSNLGVGLGYQNSIAIVNQGNDTSTAAGAARAYTTTSSGTTYSDWYLPTTAELNLMCQWQGGVNRDVTTACTGGTINSGIGASGFISDNYHSSTEYNADVAWMQNFGNGTQGISNKNYGTGIRKVRPIRAF